MRTNQTSIDDTIKIIEYGCSRLSPELSPSGCDGIVVVVSVDQFHNVYSRNQLLELLVDNLGVPLVYFGLSATLALNHAGISTGLAVEVGDTVSFVVPVHNNVGINAATSRLAYGVATAGTVLSQHLALLSITLPSSAALTFLLAEGFVSLNYATDTTLSDSGTYDMDWTLPDGATVSIPGAERFKGPELLIRPNFVVAGLYDPGLAVAITTSLSEIADTTLRTSIGQQVVPTGSVLLENLQGRLQSELLTTSTIIRPAAVDAAWAAAAGLTADADTFITQDDWMNEGTGIFATKCIAMA
jgi:hypothetical protein